MRVVRDHAKDHERNAALEREARGHMRFHVHGVGARLAEQILFGADMACRRINARDHDRVRLGQLGPEHARPSRIAGVVLIARHHVRGDHHIAHLRQRRQRAGNSETDHAPHVRSDRLQPPHQQLGIARADHGHEPRALCHARFLGKSDDGENGRGHPTYCFASPGGC